MPTRGDPVATYESRSSVTVTCREIHEPTAPGEKRTFDLAPLDDDENKKAIKAFETPSTKWAKVPAPIEWTGLSEGDFVRPAGSRVRVAHPERCGAQEGVVRSIVNRLGGGDKKKEAKETITFFAQVAFELLDDGGKTVARWEQQLPLSKLRPLRPTRGTPVTANMGVPRWVVPDSSAEQNRRDGACSGLKMMDAREPYHGGATDWPGPCTALPGDFALVDLSKVTPCLRFKRIDLNSTIEWRAPGCVFGTSG